MAAGRGPSRAFGLIAAVATAASAGLLAAPAPIYAQTGGGPESIATLADRSWADAGGNRELALELLEHLPEGRATPALSRLISTSDALREGLAKRDDQRATKLAEVRDELDKLLAEERTPSNLSKALKSAVELYLVSADKQAVVNEPRIQTLVERAAAAAHEAESKGDWLVANELFYRLNVLLEEDGRFKKDATRIANRLSMIRLYVPERFWELRNNQRLADGQKPLPAYNGLGEDFRIKLAGINDAVVLRALGFAVERHVERSQADLRALLTGGLDAVRTLVTTEDLRAAFPAMKDAGARQRMVNFLDEQKAKLGGTLVRPSGRDVATLLQELREVNLRTVSIPDVALLHEFGNGAMGRLDDYTAIVWPDEVNRFVRATQGKFTGVGISIQFDEESQYIRVVTPIEGTPAHRAGIRPDDLIKKIDGKSAIGLTLGQAVELITGPRLTKVQLTVEREGQDKEFELERDTIPLISAKGWRRTGPREGDWDWFIDPENRIGYVRLLSFTDDTTKELQNAINAMKRSGLNGLILDLRFNPGGQLSQAVSVANMFIERGTIVSTQGTMPAQTEFASPGRVGLKGVPLVVLINDGSASASEIVAGAIKHYADRGQLDARLVGQRTFGKGSVQNVFELSQNTLIKLTTQYYKLPDGTIIHRRDGAADWGVTPHVEVEMLPEQISEALTLREKADVLLVDERGRVMEGNEPRPDPEKLLADGIDLQLLDALWHLQWRLQGKTVVSSVGHARLD